MEWSRFVRDPFLLAFGGRTLAGYGSPRHRCNSGSCGHRGDRWWHRQRARAHRWRRERFRRPTSRDLGRCRRRVGDGSCDLFRRRSGECAGWSGKLWSNHERGAGDEHHDRARGAPGERPYHCARAGWEPSDRCAHKLRRLRIASGFPRDERLVAWPACPASGECPGPRRGGHVHRGRGRGLACSGAHRDDDLRGGRQFGCVFSGGSLEREGQLHRGPRFWRESPPNRGPLQRRRQLRACDVGHVLAGDIVLSVGSVRKSSTALLCALALSLTSCAAVTGGTRTNRPPTTTSRATTTTVPGALWSAPREMTGGRAVKSLDCPVTGWCMALDASGVPWISRDGGRSWVSGAPVGQPGPGGVSASSLACSSPTFCMAEASPASSEEWRGTGWSSPFPVSGAQVVQALACSGPSFCVTVDGEGDGFLWRGSGWEGELNAWGGPSSAACTSATFCVLTQGGGASLWNGSSWSRPEPIDTDAQLTGVSCPTSSFCVAVDTGAAAVFWNGSSWSSPAALPSASGSAPSAGGAIPLTGVSCPTTSFCAAVDSAGDAWTWQNGQWSVPVRVDPGAALLAVSCAAASVCVAADNRGGVVTSR